MADFLAAWRASAQAVVCASGESSEFEPSLELLRGYYLETPGGGISSFSQDLLPMQPDKRFEALFQTKPEWTHAELETFCLPLVGPGRSFDELLLSYTRTVTHPDGAKVLTRR
jgi:hypothetical protein